MTTGRINQVDRSKMRPSDGKLTAASARDCPRRRWRQHPDRQARNPARTQTVHACNTARQAGGSRQTASQPIDVRQPDAPTLQHPCVGEAAALGLHHHQQHRQHSPSHRSTAVLIGQQTRSSATRSPRQRSSNMSAAHTHQTVRSATAHPAPARPLDAWLTRHRPPAQEHASFARRSTAAGQTTSAPT